MDFTDIVLSTVDEGLKEEFLNVKRLHEENFQDYKAEFERLYFEVYLDVARKIVKDSPKEQKIFLRTGLIDIRYVKPSDGEIIKKLVQDVDSDTFFYVDEWLIAVKEGKIRRSTFEEVIQSSQGPQVINIEMIEKEYERKLYERTILEERLRELVKGIQWKGPYTSGIYAIMDEVQKTLVNLRKLDSEIKNLFETIHTLKNQPKPTGTPKSTPEEFTEHNVIRQMIKKLVGKVGLSYPALTSMFLKEANFIFEKSKTIEMFEKFRKIDPTTLTRNIKGTEIFMPPYVIIAPCYGETGICWEPIEGNNIYGRGRLAVPLYSRKGLEPFFIAFGEYRWKLEKELSFGRWMEEGLTGEFYIYTQENKFKDNVNELFVKNYLLWTTKEVSGIQKLEKEVREIFWRRVPFSDEIKEELAKKSYVYSQLWEKDLRKRKKGEL